MAILNFEEDAYLEGLTIKYLKLLRNGHQLKGEGKEENPALPGGHSGEG